MTSARDPRVVARLLRWLRPVLRVYYRAECSGLARLNTGPYLLVANHNAGAAVEPFVIFEAWEKAGRPPAYGLAHRFVYRVPLLRDLFRKIGALPATHDEARRVLRQGDSLLVFPGGEREAMRPYSKRRVCDFSGHRGWARIAVETGVSVVPVAILGSHRTNFFFYRAGWLSKLLVVPALLGIDHFPISLAQIVLPAAFVLATHTMLPTSLVVVIAYLLFLVSPLAAILPARIRVEILEPIPAGATDAEALYREATERITERLRRDD